MGELIVMYLGDELFHEGLDLVFDTLQLPLLVAQPFKRHLVWKERATTSVQGGKEDRK
jgi:hypothetical protein